MSSRGKAKKSKPNKNRNGRKTKPTKSNPRQTNDRRKPKDKSSKRGKNKGNTANVNNEELNEAKRKAKEEELARKAEEEAKEKERMAEVQKLNEEAHDEIINDYIAKFVDGAVLAEIQNMDDLDELEQNETTKPRHQLTAFLEVLLESETNKKNLHQLLTDPMLDDPLDFEALITQDERDWNNDDYGGLNYDDWELDDNEVKRLLSEWRRNVLDPVMTTYQDRLLPWCPDVPIAQELYDSFGDDDSDDDMKEEKQDEDDEKQEILEDEPKKKKKKKDKKKGKKKKEKTPTEEDREDLEENPIDGDDEYIEAVQPEEEEEEDEDEDDGDIEEEEEEEEEEEKEEEEEEEEEEEDMGSLQSESEESDDEDEESEDSDGDDDDSDEDESDDEDKGTGDSADSGDSVDDINWEELTEQEKLNRDKLYRFGKRFTANSLPQYVLQNLPSRFMAVNEDQDEQTHMAPVPWKRIFYHYKEDKISLPSNAAAKTVESEYKKIDFNVTTWDTIKEEKDSDDDGAGGDIQAIDQILQEIPDKYYDILDSSLECDLEKMYSLEKRAMDKIRRDGKKQFGEMMQNYVDKFGCGPLPKNICSDTYKQPRFVANFSNMKKYNEFCLINTKLDKMANQDSDDDEDEDEEDIPKDKKLTNEIAWAPWYTFRVRIWAKFTDQDWKTVNKEDQDDWKEIDEDDEDDDDDDDEDDDDDDDDDESDIDLTSSSSESILSDVNSMSGNSDNDEDNDSDNSDDSDDDDDAAEKAAAKKEAKRKEREERKKEKEREKEEKKAAKEEKKRLKEEEKNKKKEEKTMKLKSVENKKNGRYHTSKYSSDDPIGYKLLCDRFVCQNDHIFGRPTRFFWDEAIHEFDGGSMDHRFGVFLEDVVEDLGFNFPNLEHPLYVHPGMNIQNDLSGGIFCNGLERVIGKDMPYDLIAIDVRIPPVAQLYNMATENAWDDGWGQSSISPYKVWREDSEFTKGIHTYGDRMDPQPDDTEDAFLDNGDDEPLALSENLPFKCNAFWFNNHYMRLFDVPDPSLDLGSIESDGYTLAMMDIYDNDEYNHGKESDEWLITVGFTHPRPHYQPSVILYKNNSIEIRLKSQYDYVNTDDKNKRGHMYKQEILEIFLIYMTKGGKRDKILSMPIRQHFNEDYIIHDGDMVVVGDECVESYVLILCKNKNGTFQTYLNGRKVIDTMIRGRYSTHLLQKTKNEINNSLPFQFLIGHKRTGDDAMGKSVDIFHGFLYDIGIFAYCPQEFEINLIYRSLRLDHDVHLKKHWQRQHKKYKKENANLNFRID